MPAETIKLFKLKSEARERTEHADCTKNGLAIFFSDAICSTFIQ